MQDFILAGRTLLRRMADEIENGNTRVKDSCRKIETQLEKAVVWLRTNDDAAAGAVQGISVSHISFEDSRR